MAVVTPPRPTGASELPFTRAAAQASIELYWLRLGAGGWFVRLNGRIYEAIHALLERRRPLDLYHTALEVRVPEGRFVIENCWPIPDADGAARGVVVQGPVASRRMARFRVFRYEVRRWRDGIIADADEAVASPQPLSHDPLRARRLLDLVGALPSPVWGRDELGAGEMWNSNSVISWLLARSGLPTSAISPPAGGRAPGWEAGLVTAAAASSAATKGPGTVRGAPPRAWEGGGGSGSMRHHSGSGRSVSARVVMSPDHHPQPIQPLLNVKRRAAEFTTGRQSAAAGAVAWEEGTALDTSVITSKRGRLAVIEAEADIQRPPEDVFDYCSDHTHEPEWNSKMTDVEKLTDAPIGLGTCYRMGFTSAPSVISECVRFERPSVWEMVGRSRVMRFGWRGRVLPTGDGAHLVLRMEIQLHGLLGVAAPLLRRRMRLELERDIATIKARLEE
jgi:uncharacterized protein YndB with AHSA1/START domain